MLDVNRKSYWGDLLLSQALARYIPLGEYARRVQPRACVLGVSDGKFALPLLRAGWQVVGVESDDLFLNGGELDLVDGRARDIDGPAPTARRRGPGGPVHRGGAGLVACLPRATSNWYWAAACGRCRPGTEDHAMEALVHHAMDMVAPGGLFFGEYLIGLNDDSESGYYPTATEMEPVVTPARLGLFENADLGIRGESHLGYEQWHYHPVRGRHSPPHAAGPFEPAREK